MSGPGRLNFAIARRTCRGRTETITTVSSSRPSCQAGERLTISSRVDVRSPLCGAFPHLGQIHDVRLGDPNRVDAVSTSVDSPLAETARHARGRRPARPDQQVRRSAPRGSGRHAQQRANDESRSALTIDMARAFGLSSSSVYASLQCAGVPTPRKSARGREEQDRHVPELALFDRGHAPAGVLHVLRQPPIASGRVEAAAGLLARSAAAAAHASPRRNIRIVRRRADVGATACRAICPPGSRRPSPRTSAWSLGNVARYWPLRSPVHCERNVDRGALRAGHVRDDARVVQLDESRIDDVGRQRHGWPGSTRSVSVWTRRRRARRPRATATAAARSFRASGRPRGSRVHLPVPGVVHGERDRLPAAVALIREHDLIAPRSSVPTGARSRPASRLDHVQAREGRHVFQRSADASSCRRICVTPCASPRAWGLHVQATDGADHCRRGRSSSTGSASATGRPA